MNENILLSVVIPIYNVERTLARCVESVLGQHVEGMELILVDDGSTDRSALVANRYQNRPHVTLIHKANGGLSDARNEGLYYAKGRYVTFVDSDDYLLPDTYAPLMAMLEAHPEYDILEYSFVRETSCGWKTIKLPEREYTHIGDYWLGCRGYEHTYAWNKIYRRSLFDGTPWAKGRLFEDVYAMGGLLPKVHTLRTTSRGTYRYTYNPSGITVKADACGWRDLLQGHLRMLHNYDFRGHADFARYYATLLNIQLTTFELSGDEHDIVLPSLPYRHTWKLCMLHLLGMRRLCLLHRQAKRCLQVVSRAIHEVN
ncbi:MULTISPECIES: glycosyltransferase [Hallella]|uniref:Glycosyltransferase n=1 Tax=Hallella faecis TaxID=2841596 RepID=A0ABV1FN97_9BACT|nr:MULTISPECIES: glycosyltransferase [Hallella]MDR3844477.1 glycosyltransferase [Hallella sp.]